MSRRTGWSVVAPSLAVTAYCAPAVTGIPFVTRLIRSGRPTGQGPPGVWLTLDDGPHPVGTPAVLDLLADYRATATFFVIGEQLIRYPELGRRIVEGGHEIAVHGWDHRCLLTVGPTATRRGLRRAVDAIETITGSRPHRFRPPYGIASWAALHACREVGLGPTWWTVWGRDWSPRATPRSVQRHLGRGLSRFPSPTVLLHDSDTYGTSGSWRTTVAAVDWLLRRSAQAGIPVRSLDRASDGGRR